MKQSLLWKLSKNGYYDSYVLGTMHVKSRSAFKRLPHLEACILSSELFAAEYNLNEMQSAKGGGDLLIPDGRSLLDILGDKKFDRNRKIIKKAFNIDLEHFKNYFPLIVVNVLSEASLSKDFSMPLDLHLWNFAKKSGLELHGIETYESQLKIIHKMKIKDQVKMITNVAKNPSKFRKNMIRMAKSYENEEIGKLFKEGKKSLGKYKKVLLKNRNYIMARRLEEFSREKKTFFAIGAGHLAGSYGVLKLLKDKGWKLKGL